MGAVVAIGTGSLNGAFVQASPAWQPLISPALIEDQKVAKVH